MIVVPTKYELRLLPEVRVYEKINSYIYKMTFRDANQALIGVTGVGQENVNKYLDDNFSLITKLCTAVISIGTCGVHNFSDVEVGTCFITDAFINDSQKMQNEIMARSISFPHLHYIKGNTKTVSTYFSEVENIDKRKYSVDMEGFFLYDFCCKNGMLFQNVRIVSDHCELCEHNDDLCILQRDLINYRSLMLEILKK